MCRQSGSSVESVCPVSGRSPVRALVLAAYFSAVLLQFGAMTKHCTAYTSLYSSNLGKKGGSNVAGVTWE